MRVALVLWTGVLGGAETMTAEIAVALRRHGVEPAIVFVTTGEPLRDRLRALDVRYAELGFDRGSEILRAPRRFAAGIAAAGVDAALLMSPGYMAVSLRLGGYHGRVAAVEHGALLRQRKAAPPRRTALRAARALGGRVTDVEIAVSEFMLGQLRTGPHAADLRCIPNGVDTDAYAPRAPLLPDGRRPAVGWAGRLVRGKGVDTLLHAAALLRERGAGADVLVAGDGPLRPALERLATELGLGDRVEFAGPVQDMPRFWNRCDVGVALTGGTLTEAFGRSVLEAMACGRPVVVTRNGGLADLVEDGVTGRVVAHGDTAGAADALAAYLHDPERARAAGAAGRERATSRFGMDATAAAYAAALSG